MKPHRHRRAALSLSLSLLTNAAFVDFADRDVPRAGHRGATAII